MVVGVPDPDRFVSCAKIPVRGVIIDIVFMQFSGEYRVLFCQPFADRIERRDSDFEFNFKHGCATLLSVIIAT
jgi:hypothetical protein